jgi:periplasmic copper chaperone A
VRFRSLVTAAALALAAVGVIAAPAAAHVTVNPDTATKGGFTKVGFRTPNERDDAGTVKLEVTFPEDAPLFAVNVRPVPGWTSTVERRTLAEPVEVFGEPRTDAVAKITWQGGTIQPGFFEEFEVSMGPLPDNAEALVFKAVQTYSSGEVVRWIEEPEDGAEEPENPAPVLTLTSGDADEEPAQADTPAGEDDEDDDPLSVIALVVAAVALLLSGATLLRARR